MTLRKVILGGVLGGLGMFVSSSITHMATPLGEVGIRSMPANQEPAVLAAMRVAMAERALYLFPGREMSRPLSEEEEKLWVERYKTGPAGIVAYNPSPGELGVARLLLTELATNIAAALLAAVLLIHVPGSLGYGRRVLLVALVGFITTLDVDASYWNWYSFPTGYLLAQLADHVLAWLVAGLVMARICRE
jgi:hypothetical protein